MSATTIYFLFVDQGETDIVLERWSDMVAVPSVLVP